MEELILRPDLFPAAHAFKKLGTVTRDGKHLQVKITLGRKYIPENREPSECVQRQLEKLEIFHIFQGKAFSQLQNTGGAYSFVK